MFRNEHKRKKIIPICSGKGGVGCSTVAINISIGLAAHGRKVLLVDLDIGRGDCGTLLDIPHSDYGITTMLTDKNIDQANYCHATSHRNLYCVSASTHAPSQLPSTAKQLRTIVQAIASFSFDYIIFDVPSGLSALSKYLFFAVDSGIVVTTCHANAIQCQLRFAVEALWYHCLNSARTARSKGVQTYVEEVYNTSSQMRSFGKHLVELEAIDPVFASQLREQLQTARPFIIVNQLRTLKELTAIADLVSKFRDELGIQFDVLGAIYANHMIATDMDSHTPTMSSTVDSQPYQQLDRLCQKILLSPDYPVLPLDYENYDNGLELTKIEINNDGPISSELSHDRYQVSHYQENAEDGQQPSRDLSL